MELAGVRRGGFARELGSPGLWAETGGLGALQVPLITPWSLQVLLFCPLGPGSPTALKTPNKNVLFSGFLPSAAALGLTTRGGQLEQGRDGVILAGPLPPSQPAFYYWPARGAPRTSRTHSATVKKAKLLFICGAEKILYILLSLHTMATSIFAFCSCPFCLTPPSFVPPQRGSELSLNLDETCGVGTVRQARGRSRWSPRCLTSGADSRASPFSSTQQVTACCRGGCSLHTGDAAATWLCLGNVTPPL